MANPKGKGKRNVPKRSQFKLSEKREIIYKVEDEMSRGLSMRKASKKLGYKESSVRGIMKKKTLIMDKLDKFPNTNDSV